MHISASELPLEVFNEDVNGVKRILVRYTRQDVRTAQIHAAFRYQGTRGFGDRVALNIDVHALNLGIGRGQSLDFVHHCHAFCVPKTGVAAKLNLVRGDRQGNKVHFDFDRDICNWLIGDFLCSRSTFGWAFRRFLRASRVSEIFKR